MNQLSVQEDTFKQALNQLLANQQELQKTQQQLQSYQQAQDVTIQRSVQQISELENSSNRRHKELESTLSEAGKRMYEVLERLNQLEQKQTATTLRLSQLETQFTERLASAQTQLQESLMTQFGTWRTEAQQGQQQLSQRLDKLTNLPEQVVSIDSSLKETKKTLETHRKETAARHEGQREALADLESQMKAGQSRAARFISCFAKAEILARMSGKPE